MKPIADKIADTLTIWAEMVRESEHADFQAHHTPYGTTVLCITLGESDEPAGFTEWWREYPICHRKRGRGKCLKRWRAQGIERHTAAALDRLKVDARSKEWIEGYVPAPHKWLCDEPWDGWTAPAKPQNARPSPSAVLDDLEL